MPRAYIDGMSPQNRPEKCGENEFDLEQMEKETEEMLSLIKINKDNSVFTKTNGGFLSLKIKDVEYKRVTFYKAFPFSDPEKYISVRESNDKAKEIGIIFDLNKDVTKESKQLISEQINLRYFMPKILKIINIKDEYGFAYFDVITDAGKCRFATNTGGSAVIPLGETRLIIQDLDGNRFEIPNLTALTAKELKKLDVFL